MAGCEIKLFDEIQAPCTVTDFFFEFPVCCFLERLARVDRAFDQRQLHLMKARSVFPDQQELISGVHGDHHHRRPPRAGQALIGSFYPVGKFQIQLFDPEKPRLRERSYCFQIWHSHEGLRQLG